MRTDKLVVTHQGVKGGRKHTNLQGQVRLSVTKGFNEPEDCITVDVFKGLGHTYEAAETALINIKFKDGSEFNGTFDELKKAIQK